MPSGGFTNPMTTAGDLIYSADNSGTPARLGIDSTGQILIVSAGVPTWSGSNFVFDPSLKKLAVTSAGTGAPAVVAQSDSTPTITTSLAFYSGGGYGVSAQYGSYVATLAYAAGMGASAAVRGNDPNGHDVWLCDNTWAINVAAGSIQLLGTSGNTYVWAAAPGTPGNPATPVAWLLVNVPGLGDGWVPFYQ